MDRSASSPAIRNQANTSNASQPGSQSQQQQQPIVPSPDYVSLTTKQNPTVMRMCPPATLRNWKFHQPLLAVGDTSGVIQIFDLAKGKLHRELSVHSYSVKGIEWIGLNAFISHAVSESFQGTDSNWELNVTELDTGRTVLLKSGRSSESSVIQMVKASYLRQYFIIVYKNNPFEIWDLETLSLLRRVPKKFSGIVAAEWSPHYTKKINTSDGNDSTVARLRENFVVTNRLGELFHFSIAGNVVKEISKIPAESSLNNAITVIAWKGDHVVLGRNDGNLSVWDLGRKESRTVSTMRGTIKKIRFAPGRGNMKILIVFEDGTDIWDVSNLRLLSTITISRNHMDRIQDADWAVSDRPVVLTSDATVLVTDLRFRHVENKLKDSLQSRETMHTKQSHPTDSCYLQ